MSVILSSPTDAKPLCRHFGVCGGCSMQDKPYDAQLVLKKAKVLAALAGLDKLPEPSIVGAPNQFTGDVACRRIGEIENDAALAAVQTDESGTLAGEIGVFIAARIIAAIRVLDLDHFGAEIGQRLGAGRTGNNPGEIHHQQTIEGGRRAFLPWRAIQ